MNTLVLRLKAAESFLVTGHSGAALQRLSWCKIQRKDITSLSGCSAFTLFFRCSIMPIFYSECFDSICCGSFHFMTRYFSKQCPTLSVKSWPVFVLFIDSKSKSSSVMMKLSLIPRRKTNTCDVSCLSVLSTIVKDNQTKSFLAVLSCFVTSSLIRCMRRTITFLTGKCVNLLFVSEHSTLAQSSKHCSTKMTCYF